MTPRLLIIGKPGSARPLAVRLGKFEEDFIFEGFCGATELPARLRRGPHPDISFLKENILRSERALKTVIPQIKHFWPKTKIIIFGEAIAENVIAAACAGAQAYLESFTDLADLHFVLEEVLAGRNFVLPGFLKSGDGNGKFQGTIFFKPLPEVKLTPRELEVVNLIAQGMSNRELSRWLNISLETAKWHAKNSLQKLGLRSRVELAYHWKEIIAGEEKHLSV
jgi:DNA-binding NarL/FixJ family response regulator